VEKLTSEIRNLKFESQNKLDVVNDVRKLLQSIYRIEYPEREKFGIESQIRRAMMSVLLNLVEGNVFYDGSRTLHFKRAYGSIREVEECYRTSIILNYVQESDEIYELINKCSRRINRLISRISDVGCRISPKNNQEGQIGG
jgi:four helix bundle protein